MIKLRFGEATISQCDVMLKDIIESKRVDRLIHMRASNVQPRKDKQPLQPHHLLFRPVINVMCRLCIHVSYLASSGPPSATNTSSCPNNYTTNSPNTNKNTPKSNAAEN